MTNATALINMARQQAGLDEDTYRAKLLAITGEVSLRKMTEQQLQNVIEVFRKEGFQHRPKATDGRPEASGPYLAKMRALWIAGYNLGIVVDRTDAAMLAFIKRQAKVDDTRFLIKAKDARAAIQGLQAWLARDGGVDWSDADFMPDYARRHGFKVAWAQWRLLGGNVHASSTAAFHDVVKAMSGVPILQVTPKGWQKVMNALGRDVRAAKTGKAKPVGKRAA